MCDANPYAELEYRAQDGVVSLRIYWCKKPLIGKDYEIKVPLIVFLTFLVL